MALTVNTYWNGPMPEVIRMCLESMERHYQVKLWTKPPKGTEHMLPRIQANVMRLALLESGPNVWMDADCVVLKRFDWRGFTEAPLVVFRYLKNLQTYWMMSNQAQVGITRAYLDEWVAKRKHHDNHLTQFIKKQERWPVKILDPKPHWNVAKHDELLAPYDGRKLEGSMTHLIHTTIKAMKDLSRREVIMHKSLAGEVLRRSLV